MVLTRSGCENGDGGPGISVSMDRTDRPVLSGIHPWDIASSVDSGGDSPPFVSADVKRSEPPRQPDVNHAGPPGERDEGWGLYPRDFSRAGSLLPIPSTG